MILGMSAAVAMVLAYCAGIVTGAGILTGWVWYQSNQKQQITMSDQRMKEIHQAHAQARGPWAH